MLDCCNAVNAKISDYVDAIMEETAVREEMDCIVTRNLRDFRQSRIPVYAPEDLLNVIKAAEEK